MCAIIGAVLAPSSDTPWGTEHTNAMLSEIFQKSLARGRDGVGYASSFSSITKHIERNHTFNSRHWFVDSTHSWLIGNLRAEPTTEFVKQKTIEDQQPYVAHDWMIVHNGTIANDKELRTGTVNTNIDSAAIAELLEGCPCHVTAFQERIQKLKGSFAILAVHQHQPSMIFAAVNYRPLWYARSNRGVFLASARDYLPSGCAPEMMKPYSVAVFDHHGIAISLPIVESKANKQALVVCSGGLDSVVAATWAKDNQFDIELLHFQYGSRAEGAEVKAVKAVGESLGVPVRLFPLPIYKPEDSPLLRADSKLAGGEAGAEFAHEWVPARNLVMLAVATALAEAGGFEYVILGNNLEEAGAYPDNEPEFIARFNDLLPFAVGDGKKVEVLMPVGNLMKHEIVALGNNLGAPLDKTWSCYRAGEQHCGTCGPCFMRRTAFEINSLPEVISYADERNNS